jgi:hypothetical protein
MPDARLHRLDILPVADQQGRVEVPQRMNPNVVGSSAFVRAGFQTFAENVERRTKPPSSAWKMSQR